MLLDSFVTFSHFSIKDSGDCKLYLIHLKVLPEIVAMSYLLENSNNGGEVAIPLVSISAESNTIPSEECDISKIIATGLCVFLHAYYTLLLFVKKLIYIKGCSCGECKKKMWTQLKHRVPITVNDEVDASLASTIQLLLLPSSNSSQSPPIDHIRIESLEKESAILRRHLHQLLQK